MFPVNDTTTDTIYCEESWVPKNGCFWTVVLEKMLESPLDCKEIQPVHSEGDQPWVFFGRNDAKAETPIYFGHLMQRVDLLEKTPMLGGIGGRRKRGRQDEMVGWHHWLNGHEFEWTPGVGDGQGGLVCCNSWGCKESDTTEQLNWTELNRYSHPSKDSQVILYSFLFPTLYVVAINWISWICPLFCYYAFIIFYLETSIAS